MATHIEIDALLPRLRDLRDMLTPDPFSESREVVQVKFPAYDKLVVMIGELERQRQAAQVG